MAYSSLSTTKNECRLLQLSPAHQADDGIACHLVTVSLDSLLPRYEALSYAWGSLEDRISITLGATQHFVTKNLHSALKELRLPDRERCLWIDALCIDQSNLDERSEQVTRMGMIYGQAEMVLIWLGDIWDGCELAMKFLQQTGTDKGLHPFPTSNPHARTQGLALDSLELQAALIRFFSFPWWTRVWTVQEVVLSKRAILQCGKQLLDFGIAMDAVRSFFGHETSQECCARADIQIMDLFQALYVMDSLKFTRLLLDQSSLLYNIAQYRSRQATDLRDKIFGMLSLGKNQYTALLYPDYTLSVESVFESAVVAIIQRTKELDILSHLPALGGNRNPKLPSFVPDWGISVIDPVAYPDWLNWVGHLQLYNACNSMPAQLTLHSPGQIGLRGFEVDRIKSLASVLHYPKSGRRELWTQICQLSGIEPDPEARRTKSTENQMTAFWTVVCGGLVRYMDPYRDNRPFYHRQLKVCEDSFEEWAAWFPGADSTVHAPKASPIEFAFKVVSATRRFAVTERGYIGFVPEQSRVEDLVTVLAGGRVPIVLRQLPKSSSSSGLRYQVLGDAYIHGIMDGEACKTLGNERLTEFVLV